LAKRRTATGGAKGRGSVVECGCPRRFFWEVFSFKFSVLQNPVLGSRFSLSADVRDSRRFSLPHFNLRESASSADSFSKTLSILFIYVSFFAVPNSAPESGGDSRTPRRSRDKTNAVGGAGA
jgi:hypothetical protein